MNTKLKLEQEQQQSQEQISPELVKKFDGDKELVERFVSNGYTVQELEQSVITHPTYTDPMVTLKDGKVAGFWL